MSKLLAPIHPGEILREDVLNPLNMSVNHSLNRWKRHPPERDRARTAWDHRRYGADRLARYIGTTPEFWLKLQVRYELRVARQTKLKEIEHATSPRSEAA